MREKDINGASDRLRARAARKTKLYLASSAEPEIAEVTHRLADVLAKGAFPGLEWHYERMPDEEHSTIYHPAASRAFRVVLEPGTPD